MKSQGKIPSSSLARQAPRAEAFGGEKNKKLSKISQKSTTPRVLFVITQGQWGGAQKYVFDLFLALSPHFRITVAIGEEPVSELERRLRQELPGAEIIHLKHLKRPISPLHDILAFFELRKLYKKLKPDIVHLNSSKAGVVGSLARLFLSSLRVIYTVHGWVFLEPLSRFTKGIYKLLEKITATLKDGVIVLSEEEKNISQSLGIPASKIFLIPLRIEPLHFLDKTTARTELSNQPANCWVGTIAGLYKTKGIDILIDSIQEIRNSLSDVHFFIIGEGPEEKNLRQQIQSLHLEEKISFLGKKENAAEFLGAFDLFVLPSRKEGLPYTLLEVLQAKIPVIATKVGGIPTLLKDIPQAQIIPAEKKALADAILRGLQTHSSYSSPDFSFREMIQPTESLYLRLVNSSQH